MSVTHANKTESTQEPPGVRTIGEAAPQVVDNRASTTAQLAMQQRVHNSPRSTAQRAATNTMNASAAQQQKIIQRREPEEELQLKVIPQTAQLVDMNQEELLQGKFETAQRAEDGELLQGEFETAQLVEGEELLQGKFDPAQRTEKPNNTGLPNQLKAGIENLSGMSMDHVKVHYNSDKPAQLQAHAYAQGSEIHVAPGQEQHLPHEAWHVVQQAQGRVKPTLQMKGSVQVNDNEGLEREADVMGSRALASAQSAERIGDIEQVSHSGESKVVQGMIIPIGEVASLPDQPTVKDKEAAEVIDSGLDRLEKAGNGTTVRLDDDDKPLRALSNTEELIIFAHGGAYGDEDAAVDYFGGMSPTVLADKLIKIGLKNTYKGVIYLNGCNSATEDTHPRPKKSYAWRFRKAMFDSGYAVSVKGNAAKIHIMEDGSAGFDRPGVEERNEKNKILINSIRSKIEEFNLAKNMLFNLDEIYQKDPKIGEYVGLDENASKEEVRRKLSEIFEDRSREIESQNNELTKIKPKDEKEIYEARPDLIKTLKKPETDNEALIKVMAVGFSFMAALKLTPLIPTLGELPYIKYVMALAAMLAMLKILLNAINSRE